MSTIEQPRQAGPPPQPPADGEMPPSESLYGDRDNRIRFIEDSFYSLFTLYPAGNFAFHTAANILLLLFQQPLAVAGFRHTRGGKLHLIWSSVADPEFAAGFRDFVRADARAWRGDSGGDAGALTAIPGTGFVIGLYELRWEDSAAPAAVSFRPAGGAPDSPVALLRRLLAKMDADSDSAGVFGSLKQLLEEPYLAWRKRERSAGRRGRKRRAPSAPSPPPAGETAIAGHIAAILSKLIDNEFYASLRESPLLTYSHPEGTGRGAGKAPFPNIFFFLRTGSAQARCGRFRYALRLLFPHDQLEQIAAFLAAQAAAFPRWDTAGVPTVTDAAAGGRSADGQCPHFAGGTCRIRNMDGCIHQRLFPAGGAWTAAEWQAGLAGLLTSPLGPQARLVADSAFSSGVMEVSDERAAFGRGRLRADDAGPRDIRRFRLLSCLLHQFSNYPRSLLYPILVAGTPWILVAMVIPQSAGGGVLPSTWMMTYHFVHTILRRKIVDRLRREAKLLYLSLLQEEFRNVHGRFLDLKNWRYTSLSEMVREMNAAFRQLACVFPYPQAEVSTASHRPEAESEPIDLLYQEAGRRFLFCRLIPNPYFDRILTDRSFLAVTAVAERLRAEMRQEQERIRENIDNQIAFRQQQLGGGAFPSH